MNENTKRFFIPPFIDDLPLKPTPFRILCHLLRRAGADGVCRPKAGSIAAACHIGEDAVWRGIATLRDAGILTTSKSFGGSNNYKITLPELETPVSNHPENHTIGNPPITPEIIGQSPGKSEDNHPGNHTGSNPFKESHKKKPPFPPEGETKSASLKNLVDTLWSITPKTGRERSSRAYLEDAIKKIPKGKRPPDRELIEALRAWTKSEAWKKKDGQFVLGVHRWIKGRMWEDVPEPDKWKPDL